MKRLLIFILLPAAFILGCDTTSPPEGCVGHGGIAKLGDDATNGDVPFACKDGTVGKVHM